MHLGEHSLSKPQVPKLRFMTKLIRKYYNPPISFEHRRIWPQKENQKRELRRESQRLDQNQDQSLNPNQNLEERKNLLVDMQLAFLEDKKPLKTFLERHTSLQVK